MFIFDYSPFFGIAYFGKRKDCLKELRWYYFLKGARTYLKTRRVFFKKCRDFFKKRRDFFKKRFFFFKRRRVYYMDVVF